MLFFAGIRPEAESGEISRLSWSHVSPAESYIPPAVAQTGTDRHIPITPRLAWWIRGHPAAGPVRPAGWRRAWARIRAAAGLSGAQDITRHTFASHFLAAFGDHAAKQAMWHTSGSDTLFRHYRRAVREADARRYFRLRK